MKMVLVLKESDFSQNAINPAMLSHFPSLEMKNKKITEHLSLNVPVVHILGSIAHGLLVIGQIQN